MHFKLNIAGTQLFCVFRLLLVELLPAPAALPLQVVARCCCLRAAHLHTNVCNQPAKHMGQASVVLHVPFIPHCCSWRHSFRVFMQPTRVSGPPLESLIVITITAVI